MEPVIREQAGMTAKVVYIGFQNGENCHLGFASNKAASMATRRTTALNSLGYWDKAMCSRQTTLIDSKLVSRLSELRLHRTTGAAFK